MKINLSSDSTIYYKILGIFFFSICLLFLLIFIKDILKLDIGNLIACIILVIFIIGFSTQYLKLKNVRLDGNILIISNRRKEIKVPLSDIHNIKNVQISRGPLVLCISFHKENEFGNTITFIPSELLIKESANPVINDLKRLWR